MRFPLTPLYILVFLLIFLIKLRQTFLLLTSLAFSFEEFWKMILLKKTIVLAIVVSTLICVDARVAPVNFNVLDFGAKGDGVTDDSQAFLKAWNATCGANAKRPTMIVPAGKTFVVNPIVFDGPCKSANTFVQILGTIFAPIGTSAWKDLDVSKWLTFKGVIGLRVIGTGTLDGRGKAWWDQTCRYHPGKGCIKLSPTSMNFLECNDTKLSNLHFINSPQTHILLMGTHGVDINNIHINSPGDSPNTDGIHIQFASHITIRNSEIHSGDDCVSIGDHTSDVNVTTIQCGPGHGISIGSLGGGGNFVQVENIHVYDVNFHNTTNGVRIKTYQVGSGYCRDISFRKLNFTDVANPIIIDQYYCAKAGACAATKTGVKISNVTYEQAIGTTTSPLAINLNCSRVVPCSGLTFNSIKLSPTVHGKVQQVNSNCVGAHGNTVGPIEPSLACLLK